MAELATRGLALAVAMVECNVGTGTRAGNTRLPFAALATAENSSRSGASLAAAHEAESPAVGTASAVGPSDEAMTADATAGNEAAAGDVPAEADPTEACAAEVRVLETAPDVSVDGIVNATASAGIAPPRGVDGCVLDES